ncbi:MAG TPA: hypothetical protein VFE05_20700 [Longimicrobiaceae bacterium]|jgi:hypothetical protein|nr:hypothetical protein [Longimicrobiaceae bacterium]
MTSSSADASAAAEALKLIPALLWWALAVAVLMNLWTRIVDALPRVKTLKVAGLELELASSELAGALSARSGLSPQVSARMAASVLRRAAVAGDALRGAYVLYVDDDLAANRREIEALRALGAAVHAVATTKSAVACVALNEYDLVVTDMTRPGDATAGLALAAAVEARRPGTPVIVYVLNLVPALGVPAGISGITDRPDELFHLVFDALERRRL